VARKRDYYEVLGVPRNASEDEIRSAFRRLALQYHPDRNRDPSAPERFKEAKEAYETLIDPQKRALYDRFGHAGVEQDAGVGVGTGFSGFGGFPFDDIFETFFGGMGATGTRRQRVQRGADLRVDLTLTFEEAVFGCEKELEFTKNDVCAICGGSGVEPGTQPVVCPMCNGTGEIRRAHQSILGQFVNVSLCERCRGEGQVITTPCQTCRGQGRVRTTKRLQVTIPAGVDDGSQIRLTGEGEPGPRGGPAGNLYLVVHVQPHRYFRREGTDLHLEVPINIAQAALGDEVEVPTLEGPERIKIPPGTQHGRVIRLRGRGVPNLRGGGRGDLHVRLRVEVPTHLTEEQRQLLRKLAATFARNNTPHENRGFFGKVKDAFGV